MKIEILSIGNELLSGNITNTNAQILSKALFEEGYFVSKQRVVADDKEQIAETLKEIFLEKSLVICTGGLGPTLDDLTKEAMQGVFDIELEVNSSLLEELKLRFPGYRTLENQARVIKGAKLIENPLGTAYGMIYTCTKGKIILLPGVPEEMQFMLGPALEFVAKAYPTSSPYYLKKFDLCLTSEPKVDNFIRQIKETNPQLQFGIYPDFSLIHVTIRGQEENQVEKAYKQILNTFSDHVFSSPDGSIEKAVHALLTEKKKTVAFAESCSGGLLSSYITKQPHCSSYFQGSIICYSNQLKSDLLGVKETTLQNFGAVSKQTVQEMLLGLYRKTGADYTVAISGIAGPSGGTETTPVGTVFIGIGFKEKALVIEKTFQRGNRENIIRSTVLMALSLLYQHVKKGL